MEVLVHSCTTMLRRRLLDSIRNPIGLVSEIQNHTTGDVILPPHVTHLPFDMDALNEAQVDMLLSTGPRTPSMSGFEGLIGLPPRRRVLQRQHGLPRGMDEVDGRATNV